MREIIFVIEETADKAENEAIKGAIREAILKGRFGKTEEKIEEEKEYTNEDIRIKIEEIERREKELRAERKRIKEEYGERYLYRQFGRLSEEKSKIIEKLREEVLEMGIKLKYANEKIEELEDKKDRKGIKEKEEYKTIWNSAIEEGFKEIEKSKAEFGKYINRISEQAEELNKIGGRINGLRINNEKN